MLVDLLSPPIWRPVNGLALGTEATDIYTSTFPNTSAPEMSKNHEISACFLTNAIVTDINLVLLIPDGDKTFNGALVLDVRVC